MAKFISPNLKLLVNHHRANVLDKEPEGGGVLLEGSSRSMKTWSSVDFIIYLCAKIHTDVTINIIKETYNSFKTTLYDDFNRRLPMYGIQSPFADKQEVKSFNLYGNKINLLGAENQSTFAGAGSDYVYYNEMLDINKNVFDDSEQRCRKMWWGDYNPKYVEHWVYDKVALREDVAFLKTTFMDNPFLSKPERNKILGYNPFHPDDANIQDVKKRRPHPTNIKNGTADEYRWNVYGLGLRCSPEGLVFQHVNWINAFPNNVEQVYYGMDFGSVDPTAIVKVGVLGRDMFIELLHYAPTNSANDLIPIVKKAIGSGECWADSAEPGLIADCRNLGKLRVLAVSKPPGSIGYGISIIKRFNVHIVDHPAMRREQGSYAYKVVHGIQQEDPVDSFNHAWDAIRYVCLMRFRHLFNT